MAAGEELAAVLFLLVLSGSAAAVDPRSLQEVVEAPAEQPPNATAFSPFKPGIAVIIAILTMFFCITFLILLFAKHCNGRGDDGGNGVVSYYFGGAGGISRGANFPVCARKNSGVDRSLVESLPVFRFASLRGQKDGLECAVCLNRFESVEVLRLLPKCKHAFHVECVDTWLDAHSTCPLCRYRVDPEDLLLVVEPLNPIDPVRPVEDQPGPELNRKSSVDSIRKSLAESIRRISGRHSYAGERGLLPEETSSYRRSHDDRVRAKNETVAVAVGCFDSQCRKDGHLMTTAGQPSPQVAMGRDRKLEHRIIISDEVEPVSRYERWSDVQASDLLYLRSEMVMNDGRRPSGRSVINGRSVSDMTGMSRVAVTAAAEEEGKGEAGGGERVESRRSDLVRERASREAGAVARWTAWISQPRDVRSLNA